MPVNLEESQLAILSPNTKPDCQELLTDLRFALNRAANFSLWDRMQFNHDSRYPDWPGHNYRTCRKPNTIGTRPWGGAADLEVRLVDQIIKEQVDICIMASKRAQPHILPSDLEADDDERMQTAEVWGGVLEHYRELEQYNMTRAVTEMCGIGNEYGHALMFVGWKEEKQLVKKTLSAENVDLLLAMTFGMGGDQDAQDMMAEEIERFDADIRPAEARRVAGKLKPGTPCDYSVPMTVRAAPDWRARTPGLDIFYPPETVTIQEAQFIVETEWLSDTQMRGNVVTWMKWNKKSVEYVIEHAKAGRAAFFAGLTSGLTSASSFSWQLTSGMIGLTVGLADLTGEQQMRQWQIITVRYKAIDPTSGVPVLYKTTFHPDCPDHPLSHEWSVDEHAQYPYVEYKREMTAPTLWSSRGVGEISFSEQEELRAQANLCFDSASMKANPPYTASPRSNVSNDGLRPGMRVDAISGMANAVGVLDVGGDMAGSIEVQKMALQRAYNYFKLGMSEDMDPVAKQVAQQRVVDGFLLSMREAYRMTFAVIQQFAPDQVKYNVLSGLPVSRTVSREQILGNFTVYCDFNAADLDPDSVETRLKMLTQLIQSLDSIGAINVYPAIKLGLTMISPAFGQQMLKSPQAAQEDEMEAAEANLERNLNGLETKYRTKGGNPALRIQHTQQLLAQPALDEKGKPLAGPDGQPIPGRAARIAQDNPDVMALIQRTIANEQFLLEQSTTNPQAGRTGVTPAATQAQPTA